MPESTASARRGPMPEHAHQALEQGLLERGREPEELERVLADMGVHAQRDVAAHVADRGERGQRHVHFVSDSACFNDDPRGMFLEEPSTQQRDHDGRVPAGGRQCRQLRGTRSTVPADAMALLDACT